MDLLKTILLYLSMLFISSVQIAPDPSTVNVTPSPEPTPYGIVATATPEPTPSPTPVPTPAITPNSEYGQLNMGDRDDDVKELQEKLSELGYYTGKIDGAYGNQTRHAVELFQYQHGLTVDGVAGKYTLTVLYESDEVQPAPTKLVATNTPAFSPDETPTPPPASETPAATVTPSPEPTATSEPTATPEPTDTPDPNVPVILETYDFVLAGYTDALTMQDSDTVLHPMEAEEILYVPLIEILESAGNVIIQNDEDGTEEVAFSVLTNFYQVSYTQNDDGGLSDLVFEKNAEPQPLNTRNAIVMDGILYLPLEDIQRITGIAFDMDEAGGTITVTMPSAG